MTEVSAQGPFVTLLLTSKLVTLEQIQTCQAALGSEANDQGLAQELVRRGLITPWQLQRLRSGTKDFFLGKYKLLSLLGQGGMGAVFKAEHVAMGRIVALKVMSKDFAKDADAVARFRREILAASALVDPHIVHAYDADFVFNTHILVMEYVAGEDLESLVRRVGPLPVGTACEFIRQAAIGLQHAYEQGMTHRDIKPANLLVGQSATGGLPIIKILDMGLARLTTGAPEDGGLTRTGQIMGTPDYIAPEQANDTRLADIRSDIFSLGCALFRVVTGQVPYPGQGVMEKLMARAVGEARRARSLRGDLPAALDDVIARMLAREPAQRYQTPHQVIDALAPFADARPAVAAPTLAATAPLHSSGEMTSSGEEAVVAAPVSLQPELADFLQNLASEAAAEEVVAAAALTLSGRSNDRDTRVLGRNPTLPPRPVDRLQQQAEQQRQRERRRLLRALLITLLLLLPLAGYLGWHFTGRTSINLTWLQADRSGAELTVDGKLKPIPEEEEFSLTGEAGLRSVKLQRKGFEPIEQSWTLARGARVQFRPEWKPTTATSRTAELSELKAAAATLVLTGDATQYDHPKIVELQDRLRAFRLRWPGSADSLAAARVCTDLPSPADVLQRDRIDPAELRACGEGDPTHAPAELVAVLGDTRLQQSRPINALAFSPDGRLLASACEDAAIKIWDVATGRQVQTLTDQVFHTSSLAFTPDGKTLISGADVVHVWDVESWSLRRMTGQEYHVHSLAISRDGTRLASCDASGKLSVRELPSGDVLHTQQASTGDRTSLSFRSDGKVIASGCWDMTAKLWDAATGALLRTLHPGESRVKGVAFAATGNLLATACDSGLVQLWDSDTGREVRVLRGHNLHAFTVISLGDGQRLASGEAYQNRIIAWDTNSDAPLQTLNLGGDECSIMCLASTGDGRRLAAGDSFGRIRLFDTDAWKELNPRQGHHGPIKLLVSHPQGRTIATAGIDQTVRIWDLAEGRLLQTFPQPWPVMSLAYCPQGDTLAIALHTLEATLNLRLLNVQTGDYLKSAVPVPRSRFEIVFTPDGLGLACVDNQQEAVIFDVHSLQELRKIPGSFRHVALSPNGQTMATAHMADPEVRLWNPTHGTLIRKIDIKTPHILALEFTRDGKYVATIAVGTPVQFWETTSGKQKSLLDGAFDAAQVMAFSPDGQLLAASGVEGDGLLRVWELRSGNLLQTIRPTGALQYPPVNYALTFTEDSRHLVTANNNGTLYVVRLRERGQSIARPAAE